MIACRACTLLNPPGAVLCEACSAFLEDCAPCADNAGAANAGAADYLVTARRLWGGLADVCVEGEWRAEG